MKSQPLKLNLLLWGWVAMTLGCVVGLILAEALVGDFGSGPGTVIQVRDWMQSSAIMVLAFHLVLLLVVFVGSLSVAKHRGGLAWAATVTFGAAALAVLAGVLLYAFMGGGPWKADAVELQVLKAVVFVPPGLRSVGWLLLMLGLLSEPLRAPSFIKWAACGLIVLDLVVVFWVAVNTSFAVMPRMHPGNLEPLLMIPFVGGSVLFIGVLAVNQRTKVKTD